MFWALNLKPNRKYSQTSPETFHISSAALDTIDDPKGNIAQIFIRSDNEKYLVCTLKKDICEQVNLDLNFSSGESICFESVGNGKVTLSGYLVANQFYDDDSDDEELDLSNEISGGKKSKTSKLANAGEEDDDGDEDSDDEDEEDFDIEAELEDDDESDEEEGELEEEEDEEEDDDEEIEDEDQETRAKKPKLDKPHKQQNGVAKEVDTSTEKTTTKKSKKDKKQKQQQQQQPQQQQNKKQQQQQQKQESQQKAGGERTLTGGVKVEDIRVGNGPEVKSGKRAQVYYEGRLKTNNKVFDSCKQGSGLKFRIGGGEVIKGWDVGVVGMKVGGKRRITCPPHMAYGARGMPPTIPPNSTLVFDVEVKGVN